MTFGSRNLITNKLDKNKKQYTMKKLAIITASLLMVFSGLNMSAQTSKYGHGEDSLNCLKYLSFYTERFKKDANDPMALANWRLAYKYCPPTASENLFINGTKMLNSLRSKTKDAKYRAALADSILVLQDQRIATYPKNRVSVLNNKGQYIINFKSSDADYMYESLSAITEELGNATKSPILSALMQSAIAMYREEKLSADDIIALYEKECAILDVANPRNEKEVATLAEDREKIESMFAASKVASCENLIAIFGPRFDADPENLSLVSKIVQLMNTADDCASNDLYLKAATAKYKLDPSHGSAFASTPPAAMWQTPASTSRRLSTPLSQMTQRMPSTSMRWQPSATRTVCAQGLTMQHARPQTLTTDMPERPIWLWVTSGHRPPATTL